MTTSAETYQADEVALIDDGPTARQHGPNRPFAYTLRKDAFRRGCVKTSFGSRYLCVLILRSGVFRLVCPTSPCPGGSARDCRHQPTDSNQGDHALDIVVKDIQRHFRSDVCQPSCQEMGVPHPGLDRAERVLDRRAPDPHRGRGVPSAGVGRLHQMFMFPATDPAQGVRRAAVAQRAAWHGRAAPG